MISRRGLITGLVSLVAAPAIVRCSSLMDLRGVPLIQPPLWGVNMLEGWVLLDASVWGDDEAQRRRMAEHQREYWGF
jgi:hypothetical protein